MSFQPVISFKPLLARRIPLLLQEDASLKRNRALTTSKQIALILPLACKLKKALKLKLTNSFIFTRLHLLYIREVVKSQHDKMLIRCSQLGYTLTLKIINYSLSSTNNYKVHYQNFHPKVPLLLKAEKDALAAKRAKAAHARGFFQKLAIKQFTDKLYRSLLLEFIIKNNLSFSLVN